MSTAQMQTSIAAAYSRARYAPPRPSFRRECGRTPGNRLGQQGILSAIDKRRQPAENAARIHPERRRHTARRLSRTHRFHGVLTHGLKGVMRVRATV